MNRRVLAELLHLVAGLAFTAAIFAGAAWSYPQGAVTIWQVGGTTMAAVAVMSLYELRRAWRSGARQRETTHG